MSAGLNGAGDALHLDTLPVANATSTARLDGLEPVPLSPISSSTDSPSSGEHNEKTISNDSPRSGSDLELEKGRGLRGSEDDDEEEKKMLLYKIEKVELTPMEAFKWNVDGDQSPCKSS